MAHFDLSQHKALVVTAHAEYRDADVGGAESACRGVRSSRTRRPRRSRAEPPDRDERQGAGSGAEAEAEAPPATDDPFPRHYACERAAVVVRSAPRRTAPAVARLVDHDIVGGGAIIAATTRTGENGNNEQAGREHDPA